MYNIHMCTYIYTFYYILISILYIYYNIYYISIYLDKYIWVNILVLSSGSDRYLGEKFSKVKRWQLEVLFFFSVG